MRTPFVPTDPVTAKAIALQTETMLKVMRDCVEMEPLEKAYMGFLSYADSERVCEQIREHVQIAFNETANMIAAKKKNAKRAAAQESANRMTGEHD